MRKKSKTGENIQNGSETTHAFSPHKSHINSDHLLLQDATIHSAMWTTDGRKLQESAWISSGQVLGDIFPTLKFGLNGRIFYVSTNMVRYDSSILIIITNRHFLREPEGIILVKFGAKLGSVLRVYW